MTWAEARDALAAIRILRRTILPKDTHTKAVRIAERHGHSIFDVLTVAAALRVECAVGGSEDCRTA